MSIICDAAIDKTIILVKIGMAARKQIEKFLIKLL